MDMLFKRGGACELYKRPKNTYDFKNKVMSAVKIRYERVNGPGRHSSSCNPSDHEDVLMVDQLASRIFVEYQEAIDIQEALKRDNLQDKENVNNASQFLAFHPQPLPRSSDVTRNPLSSLSNEVPSLVSDISPKPATTKKQRLTSYDTNDIMVNFASVNKDSELAFQELLKAKIETEKDKAASEKRRYMMFLIEKKASGAITNEEFELFKNM
jgi:hypothetical protein